ncbi:MAG TPA: hypothetical protein VN968_03140 [Bradyrhizobium sp.]|nr:hypothetical protein [Bradyrhizobium sp.]
MLAHQPFGAPGFAGDDRFINAVMIVVAAAQVTMLEGDDVAARRYRGAMASPYDLAEHAVARDGRHRVMEIAVDAAIDRQIAGFERALLQQPVAGGEAAFDGSLRFRRLPGCEIQPD